MKFLRSITLAECALVGGLLVAISGCSDPAQEAANEMARQQEWKRIKEFCWDHGLQAGYRFTGETWKQGRCKEDLGDDSIHYDIAHIIYADSKGIDFQTRFEAKAPDTSW